MYFHMKPSPVKTAVNSNNSLKERYDINMTNLISFLNSFMSYLVLMLIIVVLAGIAVAIGTTVAKRKNAKKAKENK